MTEHDSQAAFVAEILYRYANDPTFVRPLFFAVPNGMWIAGKNPYALMNKYKAEGLHPGVCDVFYLQPRGGWSYLAIEMKSATGKTSPAQDEFIRTALSVGGMAVVCRSADEAVEVFTRYMQSEER